MDNKQFIPDVTGTAVSTSAFGSKEGLDWILMKLRQQGVTEVEIAIGPKPWGGILELLDALTGWGMSFRAHANTPIHPEKLLHQERDYHAILIRCFGMGIKHYSLHPPHKKFAPRWIDFCRWWLDKMESAQQVDVHLAVETMYPAPSPYWLDSYDEVQRFLEFAISVGDDEFDCWDQPLVADAAHLQIGVSQGSWEVDQVNDLIHGGFVSELHYSSNDKKRDLHWRYNAHDPVKSWVEQCPAEIVLVDEGRRRS